MKTEQRTKMKKEIKIHDRIWLQYYDADGEPLDEVTWCQEKIHDTDVEYIAVEKYEQFVQEIEKLKLEIREERSRR